MFKEYPDIMTIPQVAKALGIGTKAVYALVNNHEIGCKRIGRTIKVPKFCLEDYIRSARNNVKL